MGEFTVSWQSAQVVATWATRARPSQTLAGLLQVFLFVCSEMIMSHNPFKKLPWGLEDSSELTSLTMFVTPALGDLEPLASQHLHSHVFTCITSWKHAPTYN